MVDFSWDIVRNLSVGGPLDGAAVAHRLHRRRLVGLLLLMLRLTKRPLAEAFVGAYVQLFQACRCWCSCSWRTTAGPVRGIITSSPGSRPAWASRWHTLAPPDRDLARLVWVRSRAASGKPRRAWR